MNCPQCKNEMIRTKATNFGAEYDYCRVCKMELDEMGIAEQLYAGLLLAVADTGPHVLRLGDTVECPGLVGIGIGMAAPGYFSVIHIIPETDAVVLRDTNGEHWYAEPGCCTLPDGRPVSLSPARLWLPPGSEHRS